MTLYHPPQSRKAGHGMALRRFKITAFLVLKYLEILFGDRLSCWWVLCLDYWGGVPIGSDKHDWTRWVSFPLIKT